ncbi:MAG: GAF domain-containing protein [Planctomycetota bacterium]
MSRITRDYTPLLQACDAIRADASRDERMGVFVRTLWDAIGDGSGATCSWVGFYVGPGGRTPGGDVAGEGEMLLAVREPKPACSPVALHGACGRAHLAGETMVVSDVEKLGEGYVACDPRDRSELVIPCLDEDGASWGVLDLDAFDVGAFTAHDAEVLQDALLRAGLSAGVASMAIV